MRHPWGAQRAGGGHLSGAYPRCKGPAPPPRRLSAPGAAVRVKRLLFNIFYSDLLKKISVFRQTHAVAKQGPVLPYSHQYAEGSARCS